MASHGGPLRWSVMEPLRDGQRQKPSEMVSHEGSEMISTGGPLRWLFMEALGVVQPQKPTEMVSHRGPWCQNYKVSEDGFVVVADSFWIVSCGYYGGWYLLVPCFFVVFFSQILGCIVIFRLFLHCFVILHLFSVCSYCILQTVQGL